MTAPLSTPEGALRSAAAGLGLPLEGLRMLWRERSLWPLAVVPILLSLVAVGGAVALLVAFAPELYGWATAWVPQLPVERWYEWLWIGPARAGLAALGASLFVVLAGAALVLAYLLASLVASPFHDALSARVERLATGSVEDATRSGVRGLVLDAGRALGLEARRMVVFLACIVPLVVVGAIVPGAQLVTGPAVIAVTVFFLPLDYAGYTLDRRGVDFTTRRRWLWGRRQATLGFGAAAFVTCLVPGLNFVAMPVLVTAGTLLVLRFGPEPTPKRDAPAASGP